MSTTNEPNFKVQTLPAEEGATVPAVSTETLNGPKGRERSPETTEGISNAGQSQAGASVGQGPAGASVGQSPAGASARQVGGGAEDPADEEVRGLVRRHADLSFVSCFVRGCLIHKSAKDMARYWPEDYGSQKRGMQTRQPRGGQTGNW